MTYNDEELIQITESLKQEWLDKACKWLKDNSYLYANFIGGMIYYDVIGLISDFKKAMEE